MQSRSNRRTNSFNYGTGYNMVKKIIGLLKHEIVMVLRMLFAIYILQLLYYHGYISP